MRRLAAAAMGACLIGSAPAAAPVEYVLTPVLSGGRLESLAVEVSFRGDADGITDLRLPDRFTGHSDLHVHLGGFTSPGAQLARAAPDLLRVRHAPSARVVVRYTVTSGRGTGPRVDYRPDLRDDGFLLLGETGFAWPAGRLSGPARARMARLPFGWTGASTLDSARTVEDVRESVSVGGDRVRVQDRQAGGAPVRLAFRGTLTDSSSDDGPRFADTLARVLEAQRAVSGEPPRAFTGVVQTLPANPGRYFREGVGRADGLLLYLYADATGYGEAERILAHEAVHTWLPRRIGGLPPGMAEPGGYWFSEGFADFVGLRSLVRAGVWRPDDYDGILNVYLSQGDLTQGGGITNAQIVAGYGRDPALFQLPYRRGHALAMLWDDRLRRATGGRVGVEDVLRAMRARAGEGRTADKLFPLVYRQMGGGDLSSDIAAHVERGEPIRLPPSLYGGCLVYSELRPPREDEEVTRSGWRFAPERPAAERERCAAAVFGPGVSAGPASS